jgi:hypothetical protein
MAEYRFTLEYVTGSGNFEVNGIPILAVLTYFEEGTPITVESFPDPGFTFSNFTVNRDFLTSTDNPFTFNMPNRDANVQIFAGGIPPSVTTGYGKKYEACTKNLSGVDAVVEIWERNYSGSFTSLDSADFIFNWGKFGGDEFDTIVNSSLDFAIIGEKNQFDEFLDGGNRKWQVRLLVGGNIFWKGYINNSILQKDVIQRKQILRFSASDGFNSFDSIRIVQAFIQGFGTDFLGTLTSMLNQSFLEKRPINQGCDIYEERLNRSNALFPQLIAPPNAIFTDGELPQYTGDGGIILNTSLFITEGIKNLLRPFLCRLFLWEDQFYIISIPEFNKDSYRLFKFNTNATFDQELLVLSGPDISCGFTAGVETARSVKTEFTATLRLGVLDFAARGGVYENDFSIENWFVNSPVSPYAGILSLRNWIYINAIPSGQPSSYPTGTNPALVQYANDAKGERLKIWGTSSSAGIADTALSFVQLQQFRTGLDIPVAQEGANKISFTIEFNLENRGGSPSNPSNYFCGILLQIGTKYLDFDGTNTFTWASTEKIMLFPALRVDVWNTVKILDVVVPEDGAFTLNLYEAITTGTADLYAISYKNLSLKIEANDAMALAEKTAKFVTDESYSNVNEDYEIVIGDAETKNSSSAIKLNITGNPFSELWSRDGVEELPLIRIILQELANIRGKDNPRIVLTLLRDAMGSAFDIKPYQNIEFDGYYWMINALQYDVSKDFWKLEIIRLGEITGS